MTGAIAGLCGIVGATISGVFQDALAATALGGATQATVRAGADAALRFIADNAGALKIFAALGTQDMSWLRHFTDLALARRR